MEGRSLHFSLLGGFLLVDGDIPVTQLHAPRIQALLSLLLFKRDTPQARHYLALCLWPESSEAQAQTNLRNLVHQLRRLLPQADVFLALDRHTLQWRADAPYTLDVMTFEQALDEAKRARQRDDLRTAQAHLEEGVALYRGDLLPACYDDWILPERERLRQQFTHALEELIALLQRQHNYRVAVRYAQRLIEVEPLHESAYLWLMRLQMLQGNRAAALRTFQVCTETLKRDLAVEPGEALRAAYAQIVTRDQHSPPLRQEDGRSLIGRSEEWRWLLACWQRATVGGPLLCLLSGEVGIGKSRLAEELLHWARQQNISHARAQCYAAEGELLYAPVIAWLHDPLLHVVIGQLPPVWRAEIARLAPELFEGQPIVPTPEPITEPWQRRWLFEGLARAVLGADQPLLLVIDDLQWCDHATIAWLHYLLRYDAAARVLLVCTARSDELAMAEGGQGLLDALRVQGQIAELEIGPLDAAESAALAAQVLGRDLDAEGAVLIQRESEGNPLFIVEAARAELDSWRAHAYGGPDLAQVSPSLTLPPRIGAAISARLDRLSPWAAELVDLAVTIGRAFNYTLLARASGLGEDQLVRGLDELWRCRIIRERGEQEYDFCHDKLRDLAYQRLSVARRRLLHRRVAVAIALDPCGQPHMLGATLARHYEQAGYVEDAVRANLGAAADAQRIYANTVAINSCRRALSLLGQTIPFQLAQQVNADLSVTAHTILGEALGAMARYPEARDAFSAALALVAEDDRLGQARLHWQVANTWRAQALFVEAEESFDLAEQMLTLQAPGDQATYWQSWIDLRLDRIEATLWQGHVSPVAESELEQLQHAVMRYGSAVHQARLLMLRLIRTFWSERCTIDHTALERINQIIAINEASGNARLIAMSSWLAGQSRLLRHDLDQADGHFQQALRLAEQTGDMPLQARCLGSLGILARRSGDPDLARTYVERCAALAEAYGFADVLGIVEANRAWLAWHAAELSHTAAHGQRAIQYWQQSLVLFPLHWTARLPLIGVALAHGAIDAAVEHAQALLAPTQQRLPPELESALAAAVDTPAAERPNAQARLWHVLNLAQSLGFL